MNKIILMGRLTRDPEVRYSQGQNATAVAKFSVAVDRRFKRDGQPDADFFNCTAFGKQAEFANSYLQKGTKVVTIGRAENDNYTDKDGVKHYGVQVMVEEIYFAESKNAQSGGGAAQQAPTATPGGDGFMNIPTGIDEELPFA